MNGKIIWPKSRKTAPALEIPYFQRVSISVVQDINPRTAKVLGFSLCLRFSTFFAPLRIVRIMVRTILFPSRAHPVQHCAGGPG